ncbi:pleckstrin homology domain-containing family A member 5-like isoform 1-T1 [Clarias gariepinus]
MELEIAFRHRQQSGMDEQDRVSQASSVVTVLSTRDQTDKKPQSFCKRSGSVQRDPNCAVVIRGWLYKRDSTGLKLWKRRWFVLSNYCLFYYKDSREECVLGSLPLPSYKIFFCSPRECKNRKYAFKVVHQGMRSYFFSAETQEDMLGWVRALSQSACMENDDLVNRRCSSYHDFSQLGGSSESENPLHVYRTQNKPSYCTAGNEDMADHKRRHRVTQNSGIRTRSLSLDRIGEDHLLYQGSGPSTPRSHYELRSQSPLVRGDLRPQVYSTHYSPVHKAESKGIHSDQLPPLPLSKITHNPPGPFHYSTVSVCVSIKYGLV